MCIRDSVNRTVRVRIAGDVAQLTVKALTRGAVRQEFEYDIPVSDAREMIKLCEQPVIEKWRHVVPFAGFEWEVDEFLGVNEGLIVAEIELEHEDQEFDQPNWVGTEVTNDPKYFNSQLSIHPFTSW